MKARIIALCLLATLCLTEATAAHENVRAPIIHAIDHLRRDTNALRRDSGLAPIPTAFLYRRIDDRAYRLAVLEVWARRHERAWGGSVWVRLAACESRGRWAIDAAFDGGLQFHPGTWETYRRPGDARYAFRASPMEQVRVARRVLASEGWGAWPACGAMLGLR